MNYTALVNFIKIFQKEAQVQETSPTNTPLQWDVMSHCVMLQNVNVHLYINNIRRVQYQLNAYMLHTLWRAT